MLKTLSSCKTLAFYPCVLLLTLFLVACSSEPPTGPATNSMSPSLPFTSLQMTGTVNATIVGEGRAAPLTVCGKFDTSGYNATITAQDPNTKHWYQISVSIIPFPESGHFAFTYENVKDLRSVDVIDVIDYGTTFNFTSKPDYTKANIIFGKPGTNAISGDFSVNSDQKSGTINVKLYAGADPAYLPASPSLTIKGNWNCTPSR